MQHDAVLKPLVERKSKKGVKSWVLSTPTTRKVCSSNCDGEIRIFFAQLVLMRNCGVSELIRHKFFLWAGGGGRLGVFWIGKINSEAVGDGFPGLLRWSWCNWCYEGQHLGSPDLIPRPIRAMRVSRAGLEPSAGDNKSELAKKDWERGWGPPVFFSTA